MSSDACRLLTSLCFLRRSSGVPRFLLAASRRLPQARVSSLWVVEGQRFALECSQEQFGASLRSVRAGGRRLKRNEVVWVQATVLMLTWSIYALRFARCLACARALRLRSGRSEFAVWPLIDDMMTKSRKVEEGDRGWKRGGPGSR